jgi:hypothetical protein
MASIWMTTGGLLIEQQDAILSDGPIGEVPTGAKREKRIRREDNVKKAIMALCAWIILAGMTGAQEEKQSWTDTVKIKGDVRFRHETIDDASKSDTRTRQRVRARVGVYADVNEQVKAGIAAASGSDDPVSSNQSLDGAFTSKGLQLDKAYVEWTPVEKLTLVGGKMSKPFICVSDLVWDGDLNPEGLSAAYALSAGMAKLMAHAGYFWIDEVSGSDDDDRMLYTGQLAVELEAGAVKLLAGASIYSYDNMKGYGLLYDDSAFGNSTDTVVDDEGVETDVFANEYEEVEGFLKASGKAGDVPLSVYGQYVVNNEADDHDTGYLVGLSVGKAKKPGQVEVGYNYRDLEKDAVVGAFSDSDFAGGGTNGKGHKFSAKVAIARNWSFGATYFVNSKKPDTDDIDYDRLQLDLACKF